MTQQDLRISSLQSDQNERKLNSTGILCSLFCCFLQLRLTMLSIARRQNYRIIELSHTTRNEAVEVRLADGRYRFVPWRGFIGADRALNLPNARPVKLKVSKVRNSQREGWRDLPKGAFVQGCLTPDGVFAVVDHRVRVLGSK